MQYNEHNGNKVGYTLFHHADCSGNEEKEPYEDGKNDESRRIEQGFGDANLFGRRSLALSLFTR